MTPSLNGLPELDPLLNQIVQAHSSPDDESITEAAIIASVSYLQQLPEEIHWLCNAFPLLPVVVQAIQLWGYGEPPAQATLAKFKPVLSAALSRCPDCAVEWHIGFRRELKRVFQEVYSYDEGSTADFYIALDDWDATRVTECLGVAIAMVERVPMAWIHNEVKGPLVECLAEPGLLTREGVMKLWREIFLRLEKMPAGVGEKWLPGAIVLLFDSDLWIRTFGEQMFKERDRKIGHAEFEFNMHKPLMELISWSSEKVNSRDNTATTILWRAVDTVIRSSEQSLLQALVSPPFDLLRLLISHMSTSGSQFPVLLSVLSYFFQTFSTGIWQRLSVTSLHVIDLIFSNPSFENFLLHPELLPHDGDLSILLEWLPEFMATQSDHAKVQVMSKILYFCFEVFSHTRFPEISRKFCSNEGMRLLAGIIEDSLGDSELQDRDVNVSLKLDVIQVVDKYTSTIVRTAMQGDSRATKVYGLRLELDCRLLESEMRELIKPDVYRGRVIPTICLSDFWKTIEEHSWTEDDTNLIRSVLGNIGPAAVLDLLDSHKFESKDSERVKRFSKAVFDLQRLLVLTFTRMADIRPRIMRSILEDANVCTAVVSHLFNAKRQNLENADLDMLKTTFDVTGKSDLWRQLLLVSFEPTLSAVCQVSQQILQIQRIVPSDKVRPWHRGYLLAFVGKIIRQSMQIVDILCSGRSGILTTSDVLMQSEGNGRILQRFWKIFWEILNIAFISATSWAESEDKDVMKNLLRDVLEGSSVLFDSLKTIDTALSFTSFDATSPIKVNNIQQTLLRDVLTPLHNLSKWLCLNVDELRETTLNLAIRMLKRFARAEVQVKEETLVQYYRLAHGKKKNNMSEDQRERLLLVLSEHDVEPDTRKSVEAMAATRLMGHITPVQLTTPPLAAPSVTPPAKREVIDLDDDSQYLGDYLSDSELNAFMDRLEKKRPTSHEKPAHLKQTKLDFSKGTLKPPTSSSMIRTTSAPTKQSLPPAKSIYSSSHGASELAQLRAGFRAERQKLAGAIKPKRAPVAAPKTDAFGRPIDAAGKVIEPPRPPPKRVEESSSSESDSDDDAGGLFSIAKENKSPPKLRKVERKVQLLGEPVRSRIALQAKDRDRRGVAPERNSRARLEPDLESLLKRVLAWTPAHTGTFPPGTKQEDFKRVASTFTSPLKYEETFEPLLMLECWQHILQARMESLGESFDFMIENRQKVDEYVELFVTMKPTTYAHVGLMDPDLVILSNRQGSGGKECFAKVHGMKKKKDSVELSLRCIPSGDMASLLVPKAQMFGVKLFSLTPILREYGALKGLPYYDLVEEILAARPSMPARPTSRELKFTMDAYAVNEPQAAAIVGACQNEGFSLIQGPPGTGKTKTILGMVGAFLTGNAKPGSTSISIPGQQMHVVPAKPRVLLCAPSNAAVDEIVLRLIGGIRNSQGQKYQPNIVRVGRSDNINPNVRRVTLDELVDSKLEASAPKSEKGAIDEQILRQELQKVLELRNAKGLEYDRARELGEGDSATLATELKELNAQKNRIGTQLDDQKEKRLAMVRDADINRRQIIAAILEEADVICCTLSGSGHDQLLKMKVDFETVIIDEAAQSIELAALIPLKYGCQRCILVGDPNQLPPTVLSQAAAKFLYEESLFVRMQRNHPKSVYLLSIQYRMNPEISRFPSLKFYDGKLIDGPDMASSTAREWHLSTLFRPYCFFNVHGGQQERGQRGVSLMNKAEVHIALNIYDRLRRDFGHIDFAGKIGIVTPYKEQLRELLRQFRRLYGNDITNSVDFNTIDGFQGQEKDIIILSCVRASQDQGVGFLKDVRRINVALTRAKSTLFILGNKSALRGNEFWRDLIMDAEKRGVLVDCGPNTFATNTVVPVIRSNSEINPLARPAHKKGVKAKASQVMGEMIPLGAKGSGSKKTPITIDSDVEMRDGSDSSTESSSESDSTSDADSSSDSSSSEEEGEIKDVEMTDALPDIPIIKAQRPDAKKKSITEPEIKRKHKAPRSPILSKADTVHKTLHNKIKKKTEPDQIRDKAIKSDVKVPKETKSLKVVKKSKSTEHQKDVSSIPVEKHHKKLETLDTASHLSGIKINKRPGTSDAPNQGVYKRKVPTGGVFLKSNRPNISSGNTNGALASSPSTKKKESVRERLARQMLPPR